MNKLFTDKLNKRTKDKRVPYATIKQFIQQLTLRSTPSILGGRGWGALFSKEIPAEYSNEKIPNEARVLILTSTPYVGCVSCWFSPLLREVFLRVLRFSPLLKNQHFQIPIRSGTHGHVSTSSHELPSAPWINKLQFN